MKLRIQLESPLCAGSGLSHPAGADRDVVFDEYGLPWIPARRLKGLWRDAYRDLLAGVGSLKSDLPDEKQLFGNIGEQERGSLLLGSARLVNYDAMRPWIASFVAGTLGQDRRAAVVDAFSSLRRQTAIDRLTGVAKEETLRSTRVINPGLVFETPIRGSLSSEQHWALALAAAALREMGSSRWRGLGRVRCSVIEGDIDHTRAALDALTPDRFKPRPVTAESSPPARFTPAPSSENGVLHFSLLLQELAVFPQLAGDPNTVNSAPLIPGRVIHGWFAQKYLRRNGTTPDDRFRELFTSGHVRFCDCLFSEPAPHSLRVSKIDPDKIFDLTRVKAENVRRPPRHWLDPRELASGYAVWKEPAMELHYHHARARDPRLQRPVGVDQAHLFDLKPEEAGAFFQYESLAAGQEFLGEIRGDQPALAELAKLVHHGEHLELGRSRTAQYGAHAVWQWRTSPPSQLPNAQDTQELTILALSPVLGRNAHGHPSPAFPLEELENELGVKLVPITEFCRTQWHAGYLSHQRLARSQQPAWQTGSVLVVRTGGGERLPAAALQKAAERAYGLRCEQGYGTIRIMPGSGATDQPLLGVREPLPESPSAKAANPITSGLAEVIFSSQVRRMARRAAQEKARHDVAAKDIPNKSLLHRLRHMLEAQNEDQFRLSLKALRKRARANLDHCAVGLVPLLDYLSKDRSEIGASFATNVWTQESIWRSVFPKPPAGGAEFGKLHYLELLATLAREAGKTTREQRRQAK